MELQNGNQINIVRKVLGNEIAQLIGIIIAVYVFISMVILPIQRMEQEIDTIKNNELIHVQVNLEEIKTVNSKQDEKINEIDKKLERVITILESLK